MTPRTIAHQAPLSMGFPRQEYWSGLPFPSPGDLPNPGSNPHLLHWLVDSLPLSHQESPFPIILLLLLLSRFSRVRLCATPQTAAHQAPPSLGFPRQEHWSGLPFPSPMHERKSESEVTSNPNSVIYVPLGRLFNRSQFLICEKK